MDKWEKNRIGGENWMKKTDSWEDNLEKAHKWSRQARILSLWAIGISICVLVIKLVVRIL